MIHKNFVFVARLSFADEAHFLGMLNHFVIGKAHASHGGLAAMRGFLG